MLSDQTILKKNLMPVLFPPNKGANHSINQELQLQPASIDLRLGNEFSAARYGEVWIGENKNGKDTVCQYQNFIVATGDYYRVKKHDFILATTMEWVEVPNDMVGWVEGRSSLGRLGLRVHSTAGFIDPGFKGNITLEINSAGPFELYLSPGARVCQITFCYLDDKAARPYGDPSLKSKYQEQKGTTTSRIEMDK